MEIVDLISATNKSEQHFMALPVKMYQPFHPLSPPEFHSAVPMGKRDSFFSCESSHFMP